MPEERDNTIPPITPDAWRTMKNGVPREIVAARVVCSNSVKGHIRKSYLEGSCDHAPVLRGVSDFAALVYRLVDQIDRHNSEMPDQIKDINAEIALCMETPDGL